jgi:hypothetical protein
MMWCPTIGQAGLATDMAGAALLAWSIFRQSDNAIKGAATPQLHEIADVQSLVLARSDAKAGLSLLAIGFGLQGVGSVVLGPMALAWAAMIGGPAYALCYLLIRKRWVKKRVASIRVLLPEKQVADMIARLDAATATIKARKKTGPHQQG